MKVATVKELQSMDKKTIDQFGFSEPVLMESAGNAAMQVLDLLLDGVHGKTFLVVCGAGNNGGDALVVARKLFSEGAKVTVSLLTERDKFKGGAKVNLDLADKFGLKFGSWKENLATSDYIIDGLFGTGLSREVAGDFKACIEAINDSKKKVFSLDIASGINGENGQVMGAAINAFATITFGTPKLGNVLSPGSKHNGIQYCSKISFPPSLYDDLKVSISNSRTLPAFKPRDQNGHKGSFGTGVFISGASAYYGAPYLSTFSFMKSGGGYSRLCAPKSIVPTIASMAPEIVFHPQKENDSGSISKENLSDLLDVSTKGDIVVLGGGTSLDKETQGLIIDLVKKIEKPILIDGDGLTAIANDLDSIKSRRYPTILTPHIGEMSRICKIDGKEIPKDPVNILRKFTKELNSTIVLKGRHSLIGFPNGEVYINGSGNSGMATAGSGDVLCGVIAACYGLGLSAEDAARKGVFLHGLAADLAAKEIGEDGIIAQTIMDHLPLAFKLDRENLALNRPDLAYQHEIVHDLGHITTQDLAWRK
eukprot:TRINITY_DN5476_c0_g1_i1.p1 TRINITY_DN5476_c0_g1~~TRINITY_DN5476_c0_g1_i1.p1  ORF type:complete len:536 (-),score=159.49 TRINITY_DN5476_c0_g1_i1:97-1704(-)